jgi:G:T-mismatch repair DNA endonuclease (very short patch repair protein)
MSGKGKRGQTYNLNLAGSDILASDGRCNWHGCPKCCTRPKTNRGFWHRKREENMARDRRVNLQLGGRGWKVIRIWQQALQKSPQICLNRIRRHATDVT